MSALLAMVDDKPRLYSRQPRVPIDVIKAEHAEVHADLDRWGAWNRERYEKGRCRSIEHRYDETGGRMVKRPVIALPPDPMLWRVDRAVRAMPMQHGETIRMFYVKRCTAKTICVVHALRFEDFPTWMADCRAMVINIMRAQSE